MDLMDIPWLAETLERPAVFAKRASPHYGTLYAEYCALRAGFVRWACRKGHAVDICEESVLVSREGLDLAKLLPPEWPRIAVPIEVDTVPDTPEGIYLGPDGAAQLSLVSDQEEVGKLFAKRAVTVRLRGCCLHLGGSPSVVQAAMSTLRRLRIQASRQAEAHLHVMISSRAGISFNAVSAADRALVATNYTARQQGQFERIVREFEQADPAGRLVLLDGVQGSGKTYYLDGIMHALPKCRHVLVPADMIQSLAGPALLRALFALRDEDDEAGRVILYVEDADFCLLPREVDNVSPLSVLLNLSDGLLGRALDVLVVVTTNMRINDLDKALVRPGRLLERVGFDRLEQGHAQQIYSRLTCSEARLTLDRPTLAEVYSQARGV